MKFIGKYHEREVYWRNYESFSDKWPTQDWICFVIGNKEPNLNHLDKFIRNQIANHVSEIKTFGKFAELIHDIIDETIIGMEVIEGHNEISLITTWHDKETLADAFWQCFFASCISVESTKYPIKIVCTDLEGVDRTEELQSYLSEFKLGWLPSLNLKHEIWRNKEGLTTLLLTNNRINELQNLIDKENEELIHSFYAESHYEAMMIYYNYMNWGVYTTEFTDDKIPYKIRNLT